jgi:hypothetical protein
MADAIASGEVPSGVKAVLIEGLGITATCSSNGRYNFNNAANVSINDINAGTR